MTVTDMESLAALVASLIPRKKPELSGQITADLGIIDGIRMVTVQVAGQRRRCIYPLPYPPIVAGGVFVEQLRGSLTSPWYVSGSNYQVPSTPIYDGDGGGGEGDFSTYGVGPYGTGPYGR